MEPFCSKVNTCKRKRAKVEQNSTNNARSNGLERGKNKSLAYLFQSINSYARQENQLSSLHKDMRNIESSLCECTEPSYQVLCTSKLNAFCYQYKYLSELLYAMYLVSFTEKAQIHRTDFSNNSSTKFNNSKYITENTVKEISNRENFESKNYIREQNQQANIQSIECNSIANSEFNPKSEENNTANICVPLSKEDSPIESVLQGNSNVMCAQTMPYVSNMISTRWREAVELCCRHTVHLDDIARVALLFPEWIDVKWQFSSTFPTVSYVNLYDADNNKCDSCTHINKSEMEERNVQSREDTGKYKAMMNYNKTYKEESEQHSPCGVGELTARVYYLESHVPSLEELSVRQCTNEQHVQSKSCNNNNNSAEGLLAYDLRHVTAYGCYLAQKKTSENNLPRQIAPNNLSNIQINNFRSSSVECAHKKTREMVYNDANVQCAHSHSESNDSCKESTFTCKNGTGGRNATSLPYTSQSECYSECEVSDDDLRKQLSHDLRSSLSEHKLQELLRQMRRDITRADDKEREELERQQECERVIHSYEHICALFSRKHSCVNAWELINTMEVENRFDDKRHAVQQLELLLQYPESGLYAFSMDVKNVKSNSTSEGKEGNDNGEEQRQMKDNAHDASNITHMHNVKMLTRLSPAQLQCVLIKFNHTRACVQKLIKKVEHHISRNVNCKLDMELE